MRATSVAATLDPARVGPAAVVVALGAVLELAAGVDHALLVTGLLAVGWVAVSLEWWRRFWFTPASAVTLTVLRVMLGVTVAVYGLSLAPDLTVFFSDDGLLPEPTYREGRFGVFQWFGGDAALWVVYAVLLASAVAVIVGRGVRVAAPLMWLAVMSFHQDNPSLLNGGDDLIRIWTAYFAVFAVLTPSRYLSVPLLGRRAADGTRHWPAAPFWFVRVAQIQLTVIYPATVIAKLPGDTWRDGTAALYALGLEDFERFWLPEFVRRSLYLGTAMTWATLAVEFALPFLLWTRRTRWIGIVAGLGLHAGFDYSMRVGFFFWALAIGYASFVRPEEYERAISRACAFVHRRRLPSSDDGRTATETDSGGLRRAASGVPPGPGGAP